MAVPDIDKPACLWCEHASRPHGGCSIYADRPQACVDFACLWLVSQDRTAGERMTPEMRPDRSKVMFHDARDGGQTLYVHVDPAHPAAWRWGPILDHIDMVLGKGCKVHVIIGQRRIILDNCQSTSTDGDGSAARTALRLVN